MAVPWVVSGLDEGCVQNGEGDNPHPIMSHFLGFHDLFHPLPQGSCNDHLIPVRLFRPNLADSSQTGCGHVWTLLREVIGRLGDSD